MAHAPPQRSSPRIDALTAALDAASPTALEEFWSELSRTGTPLVEEVPGDPDHLLLTFVWRATSTAVEGVELKGSPRWRGPLGSWLHAETFAEDALGTRRLRQVMDSDVWFDTSVVRRDLRMTYSFQEVARDALPGNPHTPGRLDPLNPRVFPDETADRTIAAGALGEWKDFTSSVVELPGARIEPGLATRTDVPRGIVRELTMRSESRDNARRVWVYTPPQRTGDSLPVVVLHDGWSWAALAPIAPLLDLMIAEGEIPPLVVVMHESPDRDELACDDRFVEFLADELLPWARHRFDVTHDPARVIVAGQSYGGLNAVFCGLRRPDVFGNVLSQSGSFWFRHGSEFDSDYGWLMREAAEGERLDLRFYLDVGLLESYMVPANRHMRDVLVAKGYAVSYREFHGDHTWLSWRSSIGVGLRTLTSQW